MKTFPERLKDADGKAIKMRLAQICTIGTLCAVGGGFVYAGGLQLLAQLRPWAGVCKEK